MKNPSSRRLLLLASVAASMGVPTAEADTFTWRNLSGNWSNPAMWVENAAPSGGNVTDALIFSLGSDAQSYASVVDGASPFIINSISFAADAPAAAIASISGNTIQLDGTSPQIIQNGAGVANFTNGFQLTGPTTFGGGGTGVVTLNGPVSGYATIAKSGSSTFRFGSLVVAGVEQPSLNTWMGQLTISGGTIRFNNNEVTGRTALRGNTIVMNSGSTLTVNSELRVGTLIGAGIVETQPFNGASQPIFIHALDNGTFTGTLRLLPPTGTGGFNGDLVVRGPGTQTLSGSVNLAYSTSTASGGEDIVIGHGSGLVFAGTASIASHTRGAVVLNGGTFTLDNTINNLPEALGGGRLRLGTPTSTGLTPEGGGRFSLIGNSVGTVERLGRIQLGATLRRAGALTVNVTHQSTAAATVLDFQSYNREGPVFTTVDFTANNAAGARLNLGQSGANPRITFTGAGFTVPTVNGNGLLSNTGFAPDFGWATVNGSDFATYGGNGIAAVATTAFASSNNANTVLSGNGTVSSAGAFSVNSVKLAPTSSTQSLNITGAGNLNTRAFVLGGVNDFTIQNSGGGTGGITGGGTRYFHVDQAALTVNVPLSGANFAIVKAGGGRLHLGANNSALQQPLVINSGIVRSTLVNLPAGELQLRGGVLEIEGGGTFSRQLGLDAGKMNWAGVTGVHPNVTSIDPDRGSGGFAAVGGDLTLNLTPITGTDFFWEDLGFVNSGHALVFGSDRADSMVNWVNNLSLTEAAGPQNYQAREIRVIDNPASAGDWTRLSGVISGNIHDDLLKTGSGTLELTGANTYQSATLVHEGTLLVNGSNSSSFLTLGRAGAQLGGNGTAGAVHLEPGGILSPGAVAGAASIFNTGDVAFGGAGARLHIELGGTTAGGDATSGYDRLNVTGGVKLAGELTGSLLNLFSPEPEDLFFIIVNDGNDAVEGTFSNGNLVMFGSTPFEISYSGDSDTNSWAGGNDVVMRLIPEPSSIGLAVGGAALLLGRRRRRRSA